MQPYDDLRPKLDDDAIMLRVHQLGLKAVKDFLATEIRSQSKLNDLENSIISIELHPEDPSSLVINTTNRVEDPSATKAKVRDILITQKMGGTIRNVSGQCIFYVSIPSLMREYLSKADRTADSVCRFECERDYDRGIIHIRMNHDGCQIGVATISVGNREIYTLTHIEIVLPYRRRGNGRNLLAQVCELMLSDGANRLCFSLRLNVSQTEFPGMFFRKSLRYFNVPFEESWSPTTGQLYGTIYEPFEEYLYITIYLKTLIMAKYGDDYMTSQLFPHQYLGMKLCKLSRQQVSNPRFLPVCYQALRLGLMEYNDLFKLSHYAKTFFDQNGNGHPVLIAEYKTDDQLRILDCLSKIHSKPQTHPVFLNFVRHLGEDVEFDPYEDYHILTRLLGCITLDELKCEETVNLFTYAAELDFDKMKGLSTLSDGELVNTCKINLRRLKKGHYRFYDSKKDWFDGRLVECSCPDGKPIYNTPK